MSSNYRQEIIDTEPLSIKYINDNFKYLWSKVFGNINSMDIQDNSIKAGKLKLSELIVGDNIAMGDNATISWNKVTEQPTIPNPYTDSEALNAWITSGYATYINSYGVYTGTITVNRLTAYSGYVFADLADDSYGGKLNIFDSLGYLNARIGTEAGTGRNIGGTLILYKDSPFSTNPDCEPYQRVELGIDKDTGAGLFNLKNDSQYPTITMNANTPAIVVGDGSNGSSITPIAMNAGGSMVLTAANYDSVITNPNVASYGDFIYFTTTPTNVALYKSGDGTPFLSMGSNGDLYCHGVAK